MKKFQTDLQAAADTIGAETLELLGYSPKDIKKARDDFAAASDNIRVEVSGLARQGKSAVRDELRAQEAVGLAMSRFSRDLQRGVSRHTLEKDAERIARSLRLALDPAYRADQGYKRNTKIWLIAGVALLAGGIYGYKANQPPPRLQQELDAGLANAKSKLDEKAIDVRGDLREALEKAKERSKGA
jgi:hypothetical protein